MGVHFCVQPFWADAQIEQDSGFDFKGADPQTRQAMGRFSRLGDSLKQNLETMALSQRDSEWAVDALGCAASKGF
ncbi:hypothetical protein B9Z40_11035 [Limnohabitans sp. 15K]|nr:hypothetical protein B9Z40_11035 [Limnohabitans sp. 15K]